MAVSFTSSTLKQVSYSHRILQLPSSIHHQDYRCSNTHWIRLLWLLRSLQGEAWTCSRTSSRASTSRLWKLRKIWSLRAYVSSLPSKNKILTVWEYANYPAASTTSTKPTPTPTGYGSYGSYGAYKEKREPEPVPEPIPEPAPADYGNYGKYGAYGAYGQYQNYPASTTSTKPTPTPTGYGSYGSYGSYKEKREAEAEAEAELVV